MPASLCLGNDRIFNGYPDNIQDMAVDLLNYQNQLLVGNENDCVISQYEIDHRHSNRKSQNTTECVPVPSSEHVAEIVGRQGCKIKALRAKTNTYIKTPVRGDEPVFVVTGRREDVCSAKREIQSAAEHFSQIRAARRNNTNGILIPGPNSNIPGQTTIQVRVPYRVVGLVVGPKGATIKRIQQNTSTYIVTPSRDKEPIFDVTGLPSNVDQAKQEIQSHIAMRTGGNFEDGMEEYISSSSPSNGMSDVMNNLNAATPYMYGTSVPATYNNTGREIDMSGLADPAYGFNAFPPRTQPQKQQTTPLYSTSPMGAQQWSEFSIWNFSDTDRRDAETPGASYEPWDNSLPLSHGLHDNLNQQFTNGGLDSGYDSSPSEAPQRSNSFSNSNNMFNGDHGATRRMNSDPGSSELTNVAAMLSSLNISNNSLTLSSFEPHATISTTASNTLNLATAYLAAPINSNCNGETTTLSLTPGKKPTSKRECLCCTESEAVAALVPCGHHNFCMECAQRVADKGDKCPKCLNIATSSIRIRN